MVRPRKSVFLAAPYRTIGLLEESTIELETMAEFYCRL
jgi:hypothetical protein